MKHIITILAASAALTLSTATAAADTTDYDSDPYFILTEEADSAIARRDWPEAAARLCDAMAVRPDAPTNMLLLTNLASVYSCLGHDSLSLVTYDRVLDRAPSMLTTRVARGRQLLKMGRDADAYADFSEAISIDSLCSDARYYRGMIALYAGQAAYAEADFATLARVAPKSLDTALALGTLYSLTGRERQAIPYLERILDADPAAEYYASLAGCRLALGELSEASEIITQGLKLYPDDPELYYYRAWLNCDRYRLDQAHKDARRAVELGASEVKVRDLFTR